MELAAADNQDGKFFQVRTAIVLSCNSTTHNIGRLQYYATGRISSKNMDKHEK